MAKLAELRKRFRNTLNRSSQVFVRSESLNTSGTSYSIAGVDTANNVFTLGSTPSLSAGDWFFVNGSTANDAAFEVQSVSGSDVTTLQSIKDATADGDVYTNKSFEYVNVGRVKGVSIESDNVTSEADQDGRESAELFGFTTSMTLQQASNTELEAVPSLNDPDPGGNTDLYPRGYEFYINGHFVYFSGDSTVTSTTVNDALFSDPDLAKDGELLTNDTTKDLSNDTQGIMFQNILFNVGPSLDLSGGENIISVEFGGQVEFNALSELNSTRKILVSVSDFYDYA